MVWVEEDNGFRTYYETITGARRANYSRVMLHGGKVFFTASARSRMPSGYLQRVDGHRPYVVYVNERGRYMVGKDGKLKR